MTESIDEEELRKIKEKQCPDCKHKVLFHDFLGCVIRNCRDRWPARSVDCELTGEFLIVYFQETNG